MLKVNIRFSNLPIDKIPNSRVTFGAMFANYFAGNSCKTHN